jgi:hypothetical protein
VISEPSLTRSVDAAAPLAGRIEHLDQTRSSRPRFRESVDLVAPLAGKNKDARSAPAAPVGDP